jgi:TP901 family phage tail tape measure protein
MATSVGTLWVDVRFNTGTIARDLGTTLRGVGAGAGADLGGAGAAAGASFSAGFAQKLTTLGTSLGNVGRQVSLGLSLPLIAFGTAATSAFTQFDTSMTQIISLSGVARDTVEGWRQEVIALGTAYGVSAAEAAEGLYFITSSGVDAADAMEVLKIAVQGSAVGLGSVKTVADVITSAMNQYGEANLSAAQAADVLTVAVREGKGEADEMAGALATVIPLAGSMGIKFDEVSGVMSAMTLSGTSADQAATQINALLSTFQKMPPSAQRSMKALTGLDYATVKDDLATKGLTNTLRDLYNAFGDNEDAIGKVFGNIRALRGITNLFGEKEAQTLAVVNETTHAFGAQEKAVKELEQSEAYRLEQAQAKLSAAMTNIGASVTPIAAFATSTFGGVLTAFELLHPAAKTAAVSIGAIAAASGPLLYMGASVMRLVGNIGILATKLGVFRAIDGALLAMTASSNRVVASFAASALSGGRLLSVLRSLSIGAIAAGAAYVVFNNALHQNDEAIRQIGETGKEALQTKTFEQLGEAVIYANTEIANINAEKRRLASKPFGTTRYGKEIHELNELQKALHAYGTEALRIQTHSVAMADKFGITREAAATFLGTMKASGKEATTTEEAFALYTAGLKENSEATKQAATDTDAAKNSLAGIIATSKETSDAFFAVVNAQKQWKSAQDAIVAARQKVTDATKAHTAAIKGVADAQRKIVEADRKVIDSTQKVTDARQAAADAQQRLNDLLRGPSEEEQLDLRSARLAVREAQEGLKGAKGPVERERAQIALRRSQLDLIRVQGEHERNVADARKDLKAATDGVADAEQARLDAIAAAADARTALQEARDKEHQSLLDIRTAQDNVAQAERDAVGAAMGLTEAQQFLATMFSTGTIEADRFKQYLDKLKELYPELAGALKVYTDEFERLSKLPESQKIAKVEPPPAPEPEPYRLPEGTTPGRATPKPSGEGVYIPGVGYRKRATGGPVSANVYEVNERNVPEMFTSRGKQFLLPVDSGVVTPLKASEGGGGPTVQVGDIHVHGADQSVQTAYEVRRQLRAKTRTKARI